MKRLFGKSLALLLAVLCTAMLLVPALAADADSVTVTPTITITATGNVPEDGETMTIVVMPEEAGSPMPEGTSEDGNYYMEVGPVVVDEETNVAQVTTELAITYTEPGRYFYRIYQQSGAVTGAVYDGTFYLLEVLLQYSSDGNLYADVALTDANGDSSVKLVSADFNNFYPEETPTPSTSGDEYNDDPEPVDPVTPDEPDPVTPDEPETPDENPTNIDEEEVPLDDGEVEVPAEEEPTIVNIDDNQVPHGNVTIEDEAVPQGALPQTGQLWWPVFLMAALGLALLAAAGVDLLQTKRHSDCG